VHGLQGLADRELDVLVVGGGIFGCGVAREAALNGLRVGLVEKGDLGEATSSRSSKMIHGGLRYLKHLEFGLVRQALSERRILATIAPHLVRPCPFLVPVTQGGPRLGLRMGLWLYDRLARAERKHRRSFHRPSELAQLEPNLEPRELVSVGRYWDWLAYDGRLVSEVAMAAEEAGAQIVTRAEAGPVEGSTGRFEIPVTDRSEGGDGETITIRARTVVATVGPWSDLYRQSCEPHAVARTRLTSGAHLVVPKITQDHAVVVLAQSDGRAFFLLPFFGRTLIGTTDRDHAGAPDTAEVTREDVDYLLGETNRLLRGRDLGHEDIIQGFVGVRTLSARDDAPPSRVSREQSIFEEPEGVVHAVGGKLTTWRLIARELLERAATAGGLTIDDGTFSRTTPLPGARGDFDLPTTIDDPAALVRLASQSGAQSLVDVLRRRTPVLLLNRLSRQELLPLAEAMGSVLDWNADRCGQEVDAALVEQARPWESTTSSPSP